MAGSVVLDTAIGLVFVFLTASLVCTGILEWLSNKLNKRGEYLLRGLREMLDLPPSSPGVPVDDAERSSMPQHLLARNGRRETLQLLSTTGEGLRDQLSSAAVGTVTPAVPIADLVLSHPLVAALHRPKRPGQVGGGMQLSSYLSAQTFARSLIDLLVPNGAGKTSLAELTERVERLDKSVPARAALLSLLRDTGGTVDDFRKRLEQWYDEQMGRVSGWYKRWAQWRLLLVGLLLALVMNVDTVRVARALYQDTAVRDAVVAQAVSAQSCPTAVGPDRQTCLSRQNEVLRGLGLPIGWNVDRAGAECRAYSAGATCRNPMHAVPFAVHAATRNGADGLLLKILGWIVTGLGVSLGAPFWFDALGKLGSLRTAGRRPGENAPFKPA